MKRKYVKFIAAFCVVLMLCVSAVGCESSINTRDDVQSKEDNDDDEKSSLEDKLSQVIELTENPDATPAPEQRAVSSENLFKMGEDVTEDGIDNGAEIPDAFVYTVKDAKMYNSVDEAGVSKDYIVDNYSGEDLLDEGGDMKPNVKFLVVEMAIKNAKDKSAKKNITAVNFMYETSEGSMSNEEGTIGFLDMPLPNYFSDPTGKRDADGDWAEYYDYSIPLGQSKNIKVGWYIDTERYDISKLYFVFNRDCDNEKFVKLEIK